MIPLLNRVSVADWAHAKSTEVTRLIAGMLIRISPY